MISYLKSKEISVDITYDIMFDIIVLLHPATPRGGDQAVMPTPRGRRFPPSHQGGGAWSMVSDGVGGYHGRAELGLLCGRNQGGVGLCNHDIKKLWYHCSMISCKFLWCSYWFHLLYHIWYHGPASMILRTYDIIGPWYHIQYHVTSILLSCVISCMIS